MATNVPPVLAAVDRKRKRIFVLAIPNVSAIRENGIWHYCDPLPDEEIPQYELITDLQLVQKLVDEAKRELGLVVN